MMLLSKKSQFFIVQFGKSSLFLQSEIKEMATKTKIQLAPFDDIKLIGINTTLVDYKMAWSINKKLCLDLTRYTDIPIGATEYSFFYYTAGDQYNVYDLVSLTRGHLSWMNLSPHVDYLFIIRNEITDERLEDMIRNLREIKGVVHAFLVDVTKNLDPFLERIELHEISIQEKLATRRDLEDVKQELKEKLKMESGLQDAQTTF